MTLSEEGGGYSADQWVKEDGVKCFILSVACTCFVLKRGHWRGGCEKIRGTEDVDAAENEGTVGGVMRKCSEGLVGK